MYDGQVIEQVTCDKYLGLTSEASKGALVAPDNLIVAGKTACYALRRKCAELYVKDSLLKCILLDALVNPFSVMDVKYGP